jgi:hypothetical protein
VLRSAISENFDNIIGDSGGSSVAPSKLKEARLVSHPVESVKAPSLVPTIEPTVTTSSNAPLRDACTPHSTVVVDVQLVLAHGRLRESPREAVGVKHAPKLSPVIVTVPLAVRPTFQGQADENAGAEKKITACTGTKERPFKNTVPSNVNVWVLVPTIPPTVTASPVVPAREDCTLQVTNVPVVQLVHLHAWFIESSSEALGDSPNKPNCSPDTVTNQSPVRPIFQRYV